MGNSPPREWGTTIVNLGNYRLTKTLGVAAGTVSYEELVGWVSRNL